MSWLLLKEGLLLVIVIATDVGGRDTEGDEKAATSVCVSRRPSLRHSVLLRASQAALLCIRREQRFSSEHVQCGSTIKHRDL